MPKISEYIEATTINNTDLFVVVQNGVTKKMASGLMGVKLPYVRLTRFSYLINTKIPITTDENVVSAVDSESLETDWAVLLLPSTYTASGKPTTLVIGCHGGGGTVTSTGSQTESYSIYRYLLANGYAVMDVSGMPQSYATAKTIDLNRVMGSYMAANSYEKAYNFIVNNFNISRDGVMLNGGSNGGLTSNSIYAHTNIPIRAMAGMSPLVSIDSAWNIITGAMSGGIYSNYQNRANIITIYGMTPVNNQTELNNAVIERSKVIGFDPLNYNVFKNYEGNMCKVHSVPYKIWHPTNDGSVPYADSVEFVNRIKNAGGYAILRTMNTGGHGPETAGTQIGTFTENGSTIALYPAMVELKLWFDRFNN